MVVDYFCRCFIILGICFISCKKDHLSVGRISTFIDSLDSVIKQKDACKSRLRVEAPKAIVWTHSAKVSKI